MALGLLLTDDFSQKEIYAGRGGAFNLLGPTPPPPFFFPIQSFAHVSPEPSTAKCMEVCILH